MNIQRRVEEFDDRGSGCSEERKKALVVDQTEVGDRIQAWNAAKNE